MITLDYPIHEDKQNLTLEVDPLDEVPDFDPTAPGAEEQKQELPLKIPGFSNDDVDDLENNLFTEESKVDGHKEIVQITTTTESDKFAFEDQLGGFESIDNRIGDLEEIEIVGIGGVTVMPKITTEKVGLGEESQMVILPQEEFGLIDVSKDEVKNLETNLFQDEKGSTQSLVKLEMVEKETIQKLPDIDDEIFDDDDSAYIDEENKQVLPELVEE
jgi:hypothetical protein